MGNIFPNYQELGLIPIPPLLSTTRETLALYLCLCFIFNYHGLFQIMALLDMKILMDVFFTPTSLSTILLVASFSCVMLFLIPIFVSLIELCHKIRNIDNKVNNYQSNQEKVSLNYCYIFLLKTIILNGFFFFCVSGRRFQELICLYYKFQSVAVLWK